MEYVIVPGREPDIRQGPWRTARIKQAWGTVVRTWSLQKRIQEPGCRHPGLNPVAICTNTYLVSFSLIASSSHQRPVEMIIGFKVLLKKQSLFGS